MRSMTRKGGEACQRASLSSPKGSPRRWRMRSARAAAVSVRRTACARGSARYPAKNAATRSGEA
eukprot:6058721-Alexandrium_andersonii.AAC.1